MMKKPVKYTYLVSYMVKWKDGFTHDYDYMDVTKDLSLIEPWELECLLQQKAEKYANGDDVPEIVPTFFQKMKYRAPSEGEEGSVSLPLSMLKDKK